MHFNYLAYGIPVHSEMELPALAPLSAKATPDPIFVVQGSVPDTLEFPAKVKKPFSVFNKDEFRFEMPDIAKYYVTRGKRILIEPLCDDWPQILLYFYSNCLAAVLFQRNLIPFHVSGVFIQPGKVLLFAAPSRTGKSTTALMLQQRGFLPFTDDTALINVEDTLVYSQASSPMTRLWDTTFAKQSIYTESDKHFTFPDIQKFGFLFPEKFESNRVQLVGIVFLEANGMEIDIQPQTPVQAFSLLSKNIYRNQWVLGMEKDLLQFETLSKIASVLPAWKAIRPKDAHSFDSFAEAIENKIIAGLC